MKQGKKVLILMMLAVWMLAVCALAEETVVSSSTSMGSKTLSGDLFVKQGATLTVTGDVTVNGDVYVFGTLSLSSGKLTINGTLNCLLYESDGLKLSAGNYSYGIVKIAGGKLSASHWNITDSFLSKTPASEHVHTWDAGKVSKAATCQATGEMLYTCTGCGQTKTESIPVTDHDWSEWKQLSAATATEAEVLYRTCSMCDKQETREGAPATGETETETEALTEPETEPVIESETEEPSYGRNGLILGVDGVWRYYKNDQVQTDYSGLVTYRDGTFYVVRGLLSSGSNGLTLCDGKWYFLSHGQVQNQYSGFALYLDYWFIIENGMLDVNANGLYDYDGGQFVFAAGKLLTDVNGLWQNPRDNAWYFLANGQVQTQHTGVAEYDGAFFYVIDGKLATEMNEIIEYDGAKFRVAAGQLYAA